MRDVSGLPQALKDVLTGRDVIVFDGECVLCSGFFRFILRFDQTERFQFVVAQSELGQRLYRALDLPTADFETNLVIVGGNIHERLDAFAAATRALGGVWAILALCRFWPVWAKDGVYKRIARNRYAVFGRSDSCMVPDAALRARFLDAGF